MTLQEIVDRSRRIVFFGGAGVSTESGIPDFRSVDGLYHQQYDYPPEQILSRSFLTRTRRNSTAFTAAKCCVRMPGPTLPITNWQSWSKQASAPLW